MQLREGEEGGDHWKPFLVMGGARTRTMLVGEGQKVGQG